MGWSVASNSMSHRSLPYLAGGTALHRAKNPCQVRFANQPGLYDNMPAQYILATSVNPQGEGRVGMLLDMIDIAGGLVASRFCKGRPLVTRSLDRMEFGEPAKKFEYLTSHAVITYTGGRSMEVAVSLDAHNFKTLDYYHHNVAKGYLTYTLFDKNKKTIPEITPLEEKEQVERYIAAENRRQNRFAEKHTLQKLGTPEAFYIQDTERPAMVTYQATEKDANIHGIVFGGTILDVIYRAAEQSAGRWIKAPVKVVRQDRMNFDKPGKIGSLLTAKALITRVWNRKQAEVQVELYMKKPAQPSWTDWIPFLPRVPEKPFPPIATSFFLFEAKDGQASLPEFTPQTEVEKRRWQAAGIRQTFREADNRLDSALPAK